MTMAAVSGRTCGDSSGSEEQAEPEAEAFGPGLGPADEDRPGRALEDQFERAAQQLQRLAQGAGRDTLLYLYSRFKQDSVKESDQKIRFGGPVVSSLYQEEMIREEDKTIFDHCRENNIDHVLKSLLSKNVDVNLKDEEGRALLHWACDRGHKDLVGMLLQQKAEINSQDSEGQTALHYASACEFADIVELLLNSGADPTIQDGEGCLPEEVTDSKDISQMLRQYATSKG
uniref:acyl-CoA-binding domain-containing protein 6 isoform X6 n=1 Tax=Pristiophorus japonicus TaxID=55135 RepID=UPI00398EADB8